MLAGITVRTLETHTLPLAEPLGAQGGRIMTPAGEIAQVVSGPEVRYVAYLEFRVPPPQARGNHYHRVKREHFYVLTGRLQAHFKDLASGETAALELAAGHLLSIQPGYAHAFLAHEYAQAIEFSPQPFDPADTYSYKLEA